MLSECIAGAPVSECDCRRAEHRHGERVTYIVHKCRGEACLAATREYERARTRRVLYGRSRLVDASPAREHVRQLMAQGMGWKQVARRAGVPNTTVGSLLYGKRPNAPDHPEHRPPRRQISRETSERLLAVTLDLAPGARVDATGASRRVQALVRAGWPLSHIAERADVDHQRVRALAHGRRSWTLRETADAVARFFRTAWQGPDHRVPGASASRARRYAERAGWAPALAWDDIDDPAERPRGLEAAC